MLNVLSFFFIETIWHPVMIGDVFRCSMFWAFSLYSLLNISDQYNISVSMLNVLSFFFIVLLVVVRPLTTVFRCSTFWAFSLYWIIGEQSQPIEICFDAQCSELFLYRYWVRAKAREWFVSMLNVLSFFFIIERGLRTIITTNLTFRCSMFWAFSLWPSRICRGERSFVSMLNVLSFFFMFDILKNEELIFNDVSMLNVLSFFFMIEKQKSSFFKTLVSMLNVLSFFFIAHSTTAMNKHLLRGISEETSPCALFIHFYHYTTINKAVENCSEKILKLKIISPLSLYKYL